MQKKYDWAVIGAGPAGIAALGVLLDSGISHSNILWVDPNFTAGDFGQHWGEVSSNTSVKLFTEYLTQIQSFNYQNCPKKFTFDTFKPEQFTALKWVAEPLQWVTQQLRSQVDTIEGIAEHFFVKAGLWNFSIHANDYQACNVILATGATPKSCEQSIKVPEISLSVALNPALLQSKIQQEETVAVFGASHSAVIIMRNLLEAGVKQIINFYRSPLRYALSMGDWILYDNTGLKGETARWAHQNLSDFHPNITRHLAHPENIEQYLPTCSQVVYATGFDQRAPKVANIHCQAYDNTHGIIAPGLFGIGIGFPKKVTDPNGHVELNVGLWKFMRDIQAMMPIWLRYPL